MKPLENQYVCFLQLHHAILGGKWKLRILWHIFHGDERFSQLKRTIPDISEKVLAQELRELENRGLLIRTVVSTLPPVVQYHIPAHYAEIGPVLDALSDFARHYAQTEGIDVVDHETGRLLSEQQTTATATLASNQSLERLE